MDFTGDGIADILSGCYWSNDPDCPNGNAQAGYVYVLAGNDEGNFETATPLLNADQKPLTNVPLSQEQLENYDFQKTEMGNICTAQFAADYDADGDLDLIVGEMGRKFYLHLNSADTASAAPVFADRPTALKVELPEAHSDPHLVDWDGDGDLDLLSGSTSGSVYLSQNNGSATQPSWADFECLIKSNGSWSQSTDDGEKLTPGHGSRVWVVDFNRDGKLDLLVGDATTIENKILGLTPDKAFDLEQKYNEEMQPIQDQMQKIYEKFSEEMVKSSGDKDAALKVREKMQEESKELREKMRELRKQEKFFRDHTSTGHVWVHLQK